MPRFDDAHRWTDKELESLERRMRREYQQAAKEMRGKQAKWLEKFEREREQREKALDNTREAMKSHERWLQSQAARADWMGNMADQLAQSAHQANVRAVGMVNDHIPKVYAENANRAAYSVDKMLKADTSFTLVNEDAVRYLMGIRTEGADPTQLVREVPWFMPQEGREHLQDVRKREINAAMDIRWNRQKFTSAITQGILQGESIPNIVRRTREIYGQNMKAAIRAARTATTNAENAGRMNSFERAQRLGIDMEIEWLATLDGRTRSSHRELDGERIHTGERFSNGLRWPGDPEGPGSEVWNCRCRANGRVVGFDGKRGDWAEEAGERWARLPKGMTYEQWKAAKPVSRAESYVNDWGRVSAQWLGNIAAEAVSAPQVNGFAGVVEGQDILGTWQRRPDQFDFEIEDVMNAQGFDGKPRIVDADEFDRAVKQANGGDGLVMQRTYSAPDKATLDAYREMLYDGKWYVDCSTGGAQYGQGMYCAADYSGKLSQGILNEMEHYKHQYAANMAEQSRELSYRYAQSKITPQEMVEFSKSNPRGIAITERQAELYYKHSLDMMTESEIAEYRQMIKEQGRTWRYSARDAYDELVKKYKSEYTPSFGAYVETMTLDPSARIVTWRELQDLTTGTVSLDYRSRLIEEAISSRAVTAEEEAFLRYNLGAGSSWSEANTAAESMSQGRIEKLLDERDTIGAEVQAAFEQEVERRKALAEIYSESFEDPGSFASSLGYDAINAEGHGESGSYTVVLNRTKLIIRRPE